MMAGSYDRQYNAGVVDRDRWCCCRCGKRIGPWDEFSVHHRQLLSQLGADTPENRCLACGSGTTGCHGWIHAHPRLARIAGWLVPSWAVPAETPMWSQPRREWVQPDGEYGAEPCAAPPGGAEALPECVPREDHRGSHQARDWRGVTET